MLKPIYNKVMSNFIKQNPELTKEEISALLLLIRKTTFLGEDIESLYNIIIKLQNKYNSIK
jgi:hypothetical protein